MKISVLTPSYNSVLYIRKAIDSVLAQNFSDFEHIVVDGGSTDGTIEILKQYPHLRWISEPDKGQSDAMNKAFNLCKGDIVVYLNADDWFEHETFDEVIALFEQNKNADVIVGNLYIRKMDTVLTRLVVSEYKFRKIVLPFRYEFPYNPVSYFYKRAVQERVGDFPLDEHYSMDYWFLLRAFHTALIIKSGKVFGTFFNTGGNKTNLHKADTIKIAKIFVKQVEVKSYIYFWFYYILNIISKPAVSLIDLIKYLAAICITFRYIPLNEYKRKGFKACLHQNL